MNAIEITNFTKRYGSFVAVQEMNVCVPQGQIVGFVGKNGAGKSTTIRAMVNNLFPSEGSIRIEGLNSVTDAKKIKSLMSYIPSDTAFHPNTTASDVFALLAKFHPYESNALSSLLSLFELDPTKKIADLSLGNRKKVSIILAFLKEAKLLLMDEPTSGLDPLMQERFFSLVLSEKEKGHTVFLSSHNLSEIEKYCDRVLIIKDGRIVDDLAMQNVAKTQKQVISYQTKDGTKKHFVADEDINQVVAHLATLDLLQLEITTQTVADSFIKYYQEDA